MAKTLLKRRYEFQSVVGDDRIWDTIWENPIAQKCGRDVRYGRLGNRDGSRQLAITSRDNKHVLVFVLRLRQTAEKVHCNIAKLSGWWEQLDLVIRLIPEPFGLSS